MHVEFESVTQKHLHTKFSVATPQRREGLANRVGFATDCHTRDFFRSDGGVWRQRQQQQQQK
jgi:hypothetical protein